MTQEAPVPSEAPSTPPESTSSAVVPQAPETFESRVKALTKGRMVSIIVTVVVVLMVLSFVFQGSAPPGCLHGSGWTGPCVSHQGGFHLLWRTRNNTFGR